MKKIIVATDYSESAGSAVNYGVSLANRFGSLLSLVSAISEPYSAGAGALISIKEKIREEAIETMDKVKNEVEPRLKNGATIDTHTVDGDPGPTIARVARSQGYDLVVVGTKGSDVARELFTGSVANSLVEKAKLPVLVVPDRTAFKPVKRIMLAVDEQILAGPQVLAPLIQIADTYATELIIFHDDPDGDGKGYDPRLPEYLAGREHRFVVRSGQTGDVADGIHQAVNQEGADLLCMIFHDRGWWAKLFNTSTVSQVMFDSPTALLVLREE